MFYGFVKSQWEAGKVSVAMPAVGFPGKPSLHGTGFKVSSAIVFLSDNEKADIVELAKKDARGKCEA